MRTLCIWHLQYLESFRNGCLFCTYWLIRNFNCGEALAMVNVVQIIISNIAHSCVSDIYSVLKLFEIILTCYYSKHSLNHHFQHCAHCVYEIYSIFKVFEIAVCFAHFGIFEIWTAVAMPTIATLFKSSFPTLRTVCIWDLQCFQSFRNCCLFCTFWHIRNFYSGHGNVNYSKHSLNLHFQHCAHCVYDIYSIWKVFEMAVCFAHLAYHVEIWTALILTMLAIVNVVQIIISNIAHTVYMIFTVFWKFSKLLFVLHILAYSKFLLRSWAFNYSYGEHSLNHHFQHCAQCAYDIYSVLKVFEIAVCFAHFGLFEISTPVMSKMLTIANIV